MSPFDSYKNLPHVTELWIRDDEVFLVQVKDSVKIVKGEDLSEPVNPEKKPKKLKSDGTK